MVRRDESVSTMSQHSLSVHSRHHGVQLKNVGMKSGQSVCDWRPSLANLTCLELVPLFDVQSWPRVVEEGSERGFRSE